jgi:predicted RNA binding protein YcfA (HicA-like mRNA interferase family)
LSFSPNVWNQLKNLTCEDLIKALKKDDWERDITTGAVQAYKKGPKRITVHYHPGKTYGAKLLQGLIADIGWTEDDLRRLKVIK